PRRRPEDPLARVPLEVRRSLLPAPVGEVPPEGRDRGLPREAVVAGVGAAGARARRRAPRKPPRGARALREAYVSVRLWTTRGRAHGVLPPVARRGHGQATEGLRQTEGRG